MLRVTYGEGRAKVVALLVELALALLLLFLAFYSADGAALDAGFYVVCVVLVFCFQHALDIRQEIATPPYSFALADVPLCFLAFQDEGGYGRSVGGLLGRSGTEIVCREGARQGLVGMVDA
jgi:hypothetical protein